MRSYSIFLPILGYGASIVILFYGIACLILYTIQERKLFFPTKASQSEYQSFVQKDDRQSLELSINDNVSLSGYRQVSQEKPYSILYFWGNAEDVVPFVLKREFINANIISFNYRAYGESTGEVGEANFFSDALQIYDYAVEKLQIPKERLYIMGRSLGTWVATYVASKRSVPGVILITPYDSVRSVAQGAYPIFPVGFLLHHHFDSWFYGSLRNNRVLMLYGGRDTVIPNIHTKQLIEKWNGEVEEKFYPAADHETIMQEKSLNRDIEQFLEKIY